MRIGVTGTRAGATKAQLDSLAGYLVWHNATRLAHGDCLGVDAQACRLARDLFGKTVSIVCYPPTENRWRAFYEDNDSTFPALPYLERNRLIVDSSDRLVALPKEMAQRYKGGTWFTVRYAKGQNKPVTILWPDGTLGCA
jgi:hypothetical protein